MLSFNMSLEQQPLSYKNAVLFSVHRLLYCLIQWMLCLFFSCSADVVCLGAHSFSLLSLLFSTTLCSTQLLQMLSFLLPLRCAKRLIDCCWWSAQQFSDCIVLTVRRLTAAGLTDNRSATFFCFFLANTQL